jgi:hypothetical protein
MFSYLFDYFKDKKEPENIKPNPINKISSVYKPLPRSKTPPRAKPVPRSKTPPRAKPVPRSKTPPQAKDIPSKISSRSKTSRSPKPTYTERTRVSPPRYSKFTKKSGNARRVSPKIPEYINLCKLTDKTEICTISPCIKKITGLATDSASPTDTWIINFKENVYYNNHKIEKGFLKIFLNPNTPGISNSRRVDLLALDYEINIYKDVIKNLIEYKVCPNFIKYLASGINCSFENLNSMLNGNIHTDIGEVISPRQTALNLLRNITFLQYEINENNDKRPAINDNSQLNYRYPAVNIGFKYNMLMSEDSNAVKFNSWIGSNIRNSNFEQDLYSILFQIFVACYSMSLSKLVHNDLHSGNVFIRTSLSKDMLYYVNSVPTGIRSRFTALIYDFDRGYCERFGDNPKLQNFECNVASQCNIYIENKDIIKILCYVYSYIENDIIRNKLLELLTSNASHKKELIETYRFRNSCFLQKDDIAQPPNFYTKFNNCETIINKLRNLINKIPTESIDENNIFRCNKKYFMSNGILNIPEILKDREKRSERTEKSKDEATYAVKVSNKECDNCVKAFEDENIYDRKSFLKWSVKNHPDKGGNREKFQLISNCNELFYKYDKCDISKVKPAPSVAKISSRPTVAVPVAISFTPKAAAPTGKRFSKYVSPSAPKPPESKSIRSKRMREFLIQYLNENRMYDIDNFLERLAGFVNENPRILGYFNGENILTENQVYTMLIDELDRYNRMSMSL